MASERGNEGHGVTGDADGAERRDQKLLSKMQI